MDNKFLLFDASSIIVELPQPLRISITKAAYKALEEIDAQDRVLERLSACHTLTFTLREKQGKETRYLLLTPEGQFVCSCDSQKNDSMSAIYFEAYQFRDQNLALTHGRVFSVPKGVIVGVYFHRTVFRNGGKGTPQFTDRMDVKESMETIVRVMAEEIDAPAEEETVTLSENLEEMLTLAEQYSELENEYDKTQALKAEKPVYTAFLGAENDSDRTAATLVVGDFDDKVYKEHAQIIILDKNGKEHTAEIRDAEKPKNGNAGKLEILFKTQTDFRDFEQQGFVSPDFNSISMDVQLKAIERIRDAAVHGKHYMQDIFDGRGFGVLAGEDLSSVDAAIAAQKYPPNESQKTAIKTGINTKNAYLVMGPPGTGKTTVILEWIKYFVKEKHWRVLVSSQNNKAVDNVLERIKDESGIDMIRIGSENKVEEGLHDYLFDRKIGGLRHNILTHTADWAKHLNGQLRAWGEVCLLAGQLQSALEKKDASWQAVWDQVEQGLKPSYQRVCDAYDRYRLSAEQIRVCEEVTNAKCEELKTLKQKNTGIGKLYYWFPIGKRRKELAELCERLIKLREAEAEIIGMYNVEFASYAAQKEALIGGLYCQFFENRDASLVAEEEVKVKLRQPLDTSLGLFAAIKENVDRDLQTAGNTGQPYWKATTFYDDLKGELARAKRILELLVDWKENVLDRQNYSLLNIVLESVNLVGATCIGVNSQKRFDGLDFDVTIIDEAGQIQIHKALVPMSVSNKLIMLGDHKQIPPSADQELLDICKEHGITGDFFSKSLFEYMYGIFPDSNKIMLNTQYRMPAEIAATLSEEFYDGKYLSWEGKRNLKSAVPFLSEKPYIIIDTSDAGIRRFETKKEGAGCYNDLEADVIAEIVKKLYKTGQEMEEVGIISAYKLQVTSIAKRLCSFLGTAMANQVSATLDSFQGQERDIIIYSFTRSSRKPPDKVRIGFLNELRRLNVAMSRPKQTLILIGDMSFLAGCENIPPADNEENDDEYERYQKSEKHFGAFINKMLSDVEAHGERISYEEFQRRMGG